MGRMNHSRRGFLAALAASALAPASMFAADRVYVIGYLSGGARPQDSIAGPLAKLGYVEGRNLRFEVRSPPNWNPDTLAVAARELVAAGPDVLMTLMGPRVRALAAATRTIPIVSLGTPDPVGEGFAQSLRRPGGNITGLSLGLTESAEATMRLLRRMRPSLRRVAMLYGAEPRPAFFERSARAAGLEPSYLRVVGASDPESLLLPLAGEAIFVAPIKDVALDGYVAVARRLRIATVGSIGRSVIDYGLEFADQNARGAAIIDKVLRGGNPAQIPIEMPDRPTFRLNRTVARELGMQVPADVLLLVTELED